LRYGEEILLFEKSEHICDHISVQKMEY